MASFKCLENIIPRKSIEFKIPNNICKSNFAMLFEILILNFYIIFYFSTYGIEFPYSIAADKAGLFSYCVSVTHNLIEYINRQFNTGSL